MSNIVDSNDRNYNLAYGLSVKEMKCSCARNTCHFFIANENLLTRFGLFRTIWSHPIKINSGFRCQAHNLAIGGVSNSKHTLGQALDLSTRSMSKKEKADFIKLATTHFTFTKVYETFIHIDVR